MISEDKITKMRISSLYIFHDEYLFNSFILDLKNKQSYWDIDKWFPLNELIQKSLEKNDELYAKLVKSLSEEKYIMDSKKIINFKKQLKDMGFLKELYEMEDNLIKDFDFSKSEEHMKETMIDNLNHVYLIRKTFIHIYMENEDKEFVINFDIPEMWTKFLLALKDLVGFDVLGLDNEKYWINPTNYILKKDGIYDRNTDEKLKLEKFKFGFSFSIISGFNGFIVNFTNNELKIIDKQLINTDDEEKIIKLNTEQINKFREIIVKNNLYLWGDKHSWSNFKYNDPSAVLDGYDWYIELEFTNGAIYHVGLGNGHPDTYFDFGEDVKELFNMDLMRLKDCIS